MQTTVFSLNKSRYFILFGIIILSFAGIFAYRHWQNSHASAIWDLIPSQAVMVLETTDPLQVQQEWRKKKVASDILALPYFQKLFARTDTLYALEEDIKEFFKNKKVLTSLHITARDDFDYVFFIPLQPGKHQEMINRFTGQFKGNRRYRWGNRNFQGHIITEIAAYDSGTIFSFITYRQHIIGSYTPFLVEDVIRTINNMPSLQESTWTKISNEHAKPTSEWQVYIQAATLPKLMQVFAGEPFVNQFNLLANYAQSTHVNMVAEADKLRLDGISTVSSAETKPDYLSVFTGQSPQPLGCTSLIPNNTAILYHWGFDDSRKLGFALQQYWQVHDKQAIQAQEVLRNQYNIRSSSVFEWMEQEVALAILESNKKETQQLLFIQAANMEKAVSSLSIIANAIDSKEEVSAYIESYADVPIRQIHAKEFPALMLGNLFNGFERCFYAPIKGHIVFSNNIQNLKKLLDDIQAEQVWSHSARQKDLLQQGAIRDNFGVYIHTSRAWGFLYNHASLKWKTLMRNYTSSLKKMEYVALQLRYEQGQVYRTNILIDYNNRQTAQKLQNKFFVNTAAMLDHPLDSPPCIVLNHLDKSREILVQDVANHLYLIDTKGEILWKKPLGKKIASDVTQIDFYKNNKLQYLFATPSQIFIVDRNGNILENFPLHLPDTVQLHTLAAIDYDKNRDYRFLASDIKGNLFLYNKQGQLLDGWNPLHTGYRLSSPAEHIRIRAKDYIIALQVNGSIQVLNRKGVTYPGFPVLLNTRIHNPLFIEPGIEPAETKLTAISDDGEVITYNLLGELVSRQQFYRPSGETTFKICREASGKDWLIARKDGKTISILDKIGTVLFEKEFELSEPVVQYYDFGANLRVIAFTYPAQNQTYLYDDTGKAIGEGFIKNTYPVAILYNENFDKMLVYYGNKQQAGLVSVKLK